MTRVTRFALALLAGVALGSVPAVAHAEPPSPKATPVYVLAIRTEDADDQADALTQALRLRVQHAQGWSLLETTQSFETLAIALKCPPKPDPGCLQRIADQLHADHFVWGTMERKKAAGEVSTEMHLWARGKADVEADESYSENLKDVDSLKEIAARLFGKITGGVGGGTLVVHAGSGGGQVTVDGRDAAPLEGGVARVDVDGSPHAIGVRVPGFDSPAQQVNLPVGGEQELTFVLVPTPPPGADVAKGSGFPVRKVAEYSALVVGAGLLVAGGVEGLAWANDKSQNNTDRKSVPSTVTDVCTTEVNAQALDACNKSKNALSVSTLGWVFGGVGAALVGTGFVLMLGDHGSSESAAPATAKPRVQVVPVLGTRGGAVGVNVTF